MKATDIIDNGAVQTVETQASITPQMALDLLQIGNDRFIKNKQLQRSYKTQISGTSQGQHPFAVILSCIDSRVPSEIIFDQGIGDIFNIRIAGNFVNDDVLGSMEFACKLAGVKLIVVLGHTSCGAVKGACDAAELGLLTQLLDKIKPAVKAVSTPAGENRSSGNINFVNRVAEKNVEITKEQIYKQSLVLHDMYNRGEIDIVTAMYDVASGEVKFT